MRRALGRQDDLQFRFGNLEVRRTGQSGLEKRASFLTCPPLMIRHRGEFIPYGLIFGGQSYLCTMQPAGFSSHRLLGGQPRSNPMATRRHGDRRIRPGKSRAQDLVVGRQRGSARAIVVEVPRDFSRNQQRLQIFLAVSSFLPRFLPKLQALVTKFSRYRLVLPGDRSSLNGVNRDVELFSRTLS